MEAHDDGLEATLEEVLRDRPGETATYTHLECKIGGVERVAMACRSLSSWLKDNPQASATYLFVNRVDYIVAVDDPGVGRAMIATGKAEAGKILMIPYLSWMNQSFKFMGNQGKSVFLMDMGFGVRTAEMTSAAMRMLHGIQGLMRGTESGTTISWVSISYMGEELLREKSGLRVDGLILPRFGQSRICNRERAHNKTDGRQQPGDNWQADAVEWILDECIKETGSGVTIAFVMPVEDACRISKDLSVRSRLGEAKIHFIEPWMNRNLIQDRVATPHGLKILCIDPEVSMIPAICGLKGVVLAPVLNGYAFDINTTSVVKKSVVWDAATALAHSLRGMESDKVVPVNVYFAKRFVRPVPKAQRLLIEPEEQPELSTASARDFLYLNLAAGCVAQYYPYPGILSVVVPPRFPKLEEAARRLDIWNLVERSEVPPDLSPRVRLTTPLGKAAGRFVRVESNIHSLVLLANVRPDLSVPVRQVLLDLAMLVSQGLSSVFDPNTKEGQHDHVGIIRGLGAEAGFAGDHCHKGLVWQSLAYLHYFRKLINRSAWGAREWQTSALYGVVRLDVLNNVLVRVAQWKNQLGIPAEDEARLLSDKEFNLVENILVSAFAFNLMMVHVQRGGHFGRDVTSEVILEKEADGETVDWDALRKDVHESGRKHTCMMAIYSHLQMDTGADDLSVYRAVGTTAVSNSAFCKGLMYLGIEHYNWLRPVVRPERRCLIPRGESWSSRPLDSSQATTSSSSNPV